MDRPAGKPHRGPRTHQAASGATGSRYPPAGPRAARQGEAREGVKQPLIHLGNAGKGALECGAPERELPSGNKNWSWKPEDVTCKSCLKKYKQRVKRWA